MGRWDGGRWNSDVPLPPDVAVGQLQRSIERTEEAISAINEALATKGFRPLLEIAQSNNFSAIVSNIFTDQVSRNTVYSGGDEHRGPDLHSKKTKDSLEAKATMNLGKGAEAHNGHGGWHIVGCYLPDSETGAVRFVHVMVAKLRPWDEKELDWKRSGSTHHAKGTGHIETYHTTAVGTAKLRDGSVYRDSKVVDDGQIRRWAVARKKVAGSLPIPAHSPFMVSLRPTHSLDQVESSNDV
jgi:hypothetical protein